jgi:hypothetical protein
MKSLIDGIARTIVDVHYQVAHTQVMAEMSIEYLKEPLDTEDDILATAVKICSKKKKGFFECPE